MADQYFDKEEIRRYSEHFCSAAVGYTDLDPIVGRLITRQKELLADLDNSQTDSENQRADSRMAMADHKALRTETRTTLDRLYKHLVSVEGETPFDLARFYPNRRQSDSGTSIADLRGALERCIDGLEHYPTLPNASTWLGQLTSLRDRYIPKSDEVSTRTSASRTATQTYRQLTQHWRRHYRGCRLIMEGLLIDAQRENELTGLFLHLQMGAGRSSPEQDEDTDARERVN